MHNKTMQVATLARCLDMNVVISDEGDHPDLVPLEELGARSVASLNRCKLI